jgi:hypothetical protein
LSIRCTTFHNKVTHRVTLYGEALAAMAVNFWFEHVIDAYLMAVAQGLDWRAACAHAEQANKNRPIRVLTHKDLRTKKGITYTRQHLARRVKAKTFFEPFNLPDGQKQGDAA